MLTVHFAFTLLCCRFNAACAGYTELLKLFMTGSTWWVVLFYQTWPTNSSVTLNLETTLWVKITADSFCRTACKNIRYQTAIYGLWAQSCSCCLQCYVWEISRNMCMIFSEHARMVDINLGGSEIYGHFLWHYTRNAEHKTSHNLFSPSSSSIIVYCGICLPRKSSSNPASGHCMSTSYSHYLQILLNLISLLSLLPLIRWRWYRWKQATGRSLKEIK